VEIVIIILFVVLIVVSLLANAFRKDGLDTAATVKRLEADLAKADRRISKLRQRPTWDAVQRAYHAGERDAVEAVAKERGLRAAEAAYKTLVEEIDAFRLR
jgi:G:T/U-mismatch repair DNA glycosylase